MASKKRWINIYEWVMVILVMVVVLLVIIEFRMDLSLQQAVLFRRVDTGILLIFAADYFIRFIMANRKVHFIRTNIPELIAIIPFSSLFRVARLTRLTRLIRITRSIRLLRVALWLSRFKGKFNAFIHTNGLHYMIFITVVVTLIGAIGIFLIEDKNMIDSLWWSFLTITTGGTSPATTSGKLLASVLILVGIGFFGMVTGTIATYFLGKRESVTYRDKTIDSIQAKLDNLDSLSDEDINKMAAVLKSLRKKKQ